MTDEQIKAKAEKKLRDHIGNLLSGKAYYDDVISALCEMYNAGQKDAPKWVKERWSRFCWESGKDSWYYPVINEFFKWLDEGGNQ